MASKRKSTVPCMIPSKSKHVREEIILGSLPELLPTIPEDGILSISGEESGHFSHTSSKSESGSEAQKGGTYSCVTCRFESRDLNYFLDHMHNCHLDFRAQPTFYCLNCGVSVVRFEALALHNANAHPKIMEGLVTASLSVSKRDGVTTVEQSLFTNSGEDYKESGISLTKTPIAKMMKAKGEHKKIVVSHTVELRKIDAGKDVDPSMLTNVPELQNGALSTSGAPAMPRTTVTHVITTVSNQVFHQHTPSLYSPLSSDSNKDLPKVMIPLSSIPTYDAAMDTSSFLKTSFGKFPYPTKAELCYLTVVSEFPEEQIKLWFTAQRLKQGISWSPEEIEEARRKMFNTVFQGGTPLKQPVTPRQVNHIVTHHTVTAHPGTKGPNLQMAKVPYSSAKPRSAGVITTQANMATKPHVTRVSYSSPLGPQKFPPIVRTTQEPTKSAEATVEPDKSNGLDLAGSSSCVSSTSSSRSSSSSSISSYSSCSNGVEKRKPGNNSSPTNSINSSATCSVSVSNNGEHCAADTKSKLNTKGESLPIGSEGSNSAASEAVTDDTSKSNATCNNHNSSSSSAPELAHAEKSDNENNNYIHQTNNNNISSENSSSTCNDSVPNQNYASKSPTESTSTTVITKSNSSILDEAKCNKDFPIKGMSILQQLIKEEDPSVGDRGCPELRVDPIKINFKRLKMNEPETTSEASHQESKCEIEVSACHSSFSPPWGNKTAQQLQILRQAFSNTRWPSSLQYEELSIQTGLPKSEVVRWFSDSRYSHKNGQLKWLETYQRAPTESADARAHGDPEAESLKEPPAANKILFEQEKNKHLEGEAGLNSGQRGVWQDSYAPLLALARSEGGGERDRDEEAEQDPWSKRGEDHQQPATSQSLIEQQTEANQARDRLRMELLEV
ncbi:zinc fingers and homeoboxes protein 3 [Kryptolebias marmoratus]|uniref:Zinc fingers and homeoboxes 3a n=1 Tax=Kryptolebias marmoratus TaxID=37003 RepID=A0A3Q3BQ87_KRYMA|nr:zinc fingers and homeoboxes protein 3 [Kryptolebias marmoratus]XP_017286051.1 zinc fingers and homeoboxes protein 3 [Kryptolebias marmoratus]XP_037831021.1 zinc fingers and homeoboxes protein 3 [Kryptolebias marmoratus]XP_037831022.1 zinc fingers and homeoboxes protein 3 [Kryptolebias marmoratus]